MEVQIAAIAERIRALRDILEISIEEMSQVTGLSAEEYIAHERGERDYSFTFLYKCASRFGIDITELLTGDMPKLSHYSLVRKGQGLPIRRRESFTYQHMAYLFRNKAAEPFIVTAPYREEEQNAPIALATHAGQEIDYIIKGKLKIQIDTHIEVLEPGDLIYYNSSCPHGMIALDGEDCEFLAVVIREEAVKRKKGEEKLV